MGLRTVCTPYIQCYPLPFLNILTPIIFPSPPRLFDTRHYTLVTLRVVPILHRFCLKGVRVYYLDSFCTEYVDFEGVLKTSDTAQKNETYHRFIVVQKHISCENKR